MKKVLTHGPWMLLMGLAAALLGALVGACAAGFLHLIEWGQQLLWNELSIQLPWQTLLVCSLGGLLVGLCQRYLGDHPKGIQEAIAAMRTTGRLEYKHLPHGMLTASISLIFGASLGPEAAIMDLLGGLGTWAGDVLRALRRRAGLPQPAQAANRAAALLNRWPEWTALAAGGLAFRQVINGLYSGGLLRLNLPFQWSDLLWSLPLSLAGAAAGGLYLLLQKQCMRWAAPLKSHPILLGTLGGSALGAAGLALPLVLFSGQHAMQQAYDQALTLGFLTLFLIALARLSLTALLLAAGWKGGQFLPIMFGGAALGLAFSVLLPAIPASAAALSVMAALTAVVLPKPLIALLLMLALFPPQYAGLSIAAVGLVALGKKFRLRRLPGLTTLPETP